MNLREVFENLMYYGLESLGKYYSSYRGYVIDNEDPEGLGRITVRIPSVTKNKPHPTWAYPKTQWGGKGYGMQVLPVKGEVVWIEFEHGDTRFPIWNFAHRTDGDKPEEFVNSKIYGFKTPTGQIIILDDQTGEVYTSRTDAHGATVDYETPLMAFNHGSNGGLVKVIELTSMMNKVEEKVNEFLAHYRIHNLIDPLSGYAGPLDPTVPAPDDVDETEQSYIENKKVLH